MLHEGSAEEVIRLLVDGQARTMAVEEYLLGVVPAEMPASWPRQALMAQAVAARTYALHARLRPRHRDADLCATEHCQVWRPASRHPATDEAVAATAGEVLLWRGEPICAMYSANCGGHTDDGAAPYLRRAACPAPGERRGHGLGLCQHGARRLAEQGHGYRDILAHYYHDPDADDDAVEAAIRTAARQALGAPDDGAALARHARRAGLGAPLGPERDVLVGGRAYRLQPYCGGIVYAPVGEWEAARHTGW